MGVSIFCKKEPFKLVREVSGEGEGAESCVIVLILHLWKERDYKSFENVVLFDQVLKITLEYP